MYQIMTDEDVNRILQIETVVNIIEQTLRARAEGALVAPPRFSVELGEGALVFTAGAERKYARAMGFRVYDTFPHSASHQSQFVAILDSGTGELRGLVIGKGLIGALRTAAINAVAIKHMARLDAEYLGILGSGFQSRFQVRAAMTVRGFRQAMVYSPTLASAKTLPQI